ncbi:MAG: exodeoxyribonuclease VII large subunit [Kiritimatiellae bacterium]|nr:exodeoxyribonuclease VII large subunit [Kiritimatiellia bacterium]
MAESPHPKPFTVSALTVQLKSAIEPRFTRIYVEAEISGWRLYPSGHAYFTLKDSGAQIQAVMFANALGRCRAAAGLKDGAKVVVYGNVSIYAPRGNYQLVVLAAKLVGEGDLMQRYIELKAKLEKEGLFDAARKRPLPFLPRRIGLVTSEAGAVVHDMCTVLSRRFPDLEIRLFPCQVQGSAAAASVVRGLAYFNDPSLDWKADLLIVARGGGSFEDLFCFNDETLVRAVAASEIPVVSAVGHETDFTLCDFAADVRAGTPSMAAELAVPVVAELRQRISVCDRQLVASLRSRGEFFAQRTDHLSDALVDALALFRERLERRLEHAATKMRLLSPYGVLERGYSLTRTEDGTVVRDAASLKRGTRLVTRLAKGEFASEVV